MQLNQEDFYKPLCNNTCCPYELIAIEAACIELYERSLAFHVFCHACVISDLTSSIDLHHQKVKPAVNISVKPDTFNHIRNCEHKMSVMAATSCSIPAYPDTNAMFILCVIQDTTSIKDY